MSTTVPLPPLVTSEHITAPILSTPITTELFPPMSTTVPLPPLVTSKHITAPILSTPITTEFLPPFSLTFTPPTPTSSQPITISPISSNMTTPQFIPPFSTALSPLTIPPSQSFLQSLDELPPFMPTTVERKLDMIINNQEKMIQLLSIRTTPVEVASSRGQNPWLFQFTTPTPAFQETTTTPAFETTPTPPFVPTPFVPTPYVPTSSFETTPACETLLHPRPLHFPTEQEEQQLFNDNKFSRENFAVKLLGILYPNKKDLYLCTAGRGSKGKRKINPLAMSYLKDTFFKYHTLTEEEKTAAWSLCITKMNIHLSKYAQNDDTVNKNKKRKQN